jgi:hypothetical protein
LAFVPLPVGGEVPDGSVLSVRMPKGAKGKVRAVHAGGRVLEVESTAFLRLSAEELAPSSRPFRIAVDELPSNVLSDESPEGETNLDRLLSFFVPRVPVGVDELTPKRLSDKPWLTHPIRPAFPGQVHLVESEDVPAVVNFEWPVQGGQVEPHAFYLWRDNRFVHAPHSVVRGGRLSVTLSDFGKYFWQVEDKTGQYALAPRVIYVRRPGEPLEDGPPDTPVAEATPVPAGEEQGSFQLRSPSKKAIVAVCLSAGRSSIPLVVPNAVADARRYVVEVAPKLGPGRWVFPRLDDRLAFEATVPIDRAGNFTFTTWAVLPDGRELPGDTTPMRVSDACAKAQDLSTSAAMAAWIGRTGKVAFPASGALVLSPPERTP